MASRETDNEKKRPAEGIRARHRKDCREHSGGKCNCRPGYEASVWSAKDGRKVRKTFPSFAAARSWRTDALKGVKDKTLRAPQPTTVRQAWEKWLEGAQSGAIRLPANRGGGRFKPSALRSYESAMTTKRPALSGRSILDELGAKKLADVDRLDLDKIVESLLGSGLEPSTVRNALMPLRVIFRRAIARREIAVNPTAGLELPAAGKRERVVTPSEAERLIALLPLAEDRALWSCAFYAGLRRGELMALRWDDVDLAAGLIYVRRSYDPKAREFVSPKSEKGTRNVPLAGVLRDVLIGHKMERGGEGLVFGRTPTEPLAYSTVSERAKRAWARAEKTRAAAVAAGDPDAERQPIVPLMLHECRHSYASFMIAAGVNVKALSTFLGHSSTQITLDRYGKLMPGGEEEAKQRQDAYIAEDAARARIAEVSSSSQDESNPDMEGELDPMSTPAGTELHES